MTVSIVRIGLAETNKFSEGYDAIFGKKKKATTANKRTAAKKKAKGGSRKAKKR